MKTIVEIQFVRDPHGKILREAPFMVRRAYGRIL